MDFEFPREPTSSMGRLAISAVRASVTKLVAGIEEHYRGNRDLETMPADMDGYRCIEALRCAAICAFIRGIDPVYDVALVRQGLIEFAEA